jgi:osmotically-inducible protein OsmY
MPAMSNDAEVLRTIVDALERIPGLSRHRLYLNVQGRIVTVRGSVRSTSELEAVETAVRPCVGVRALVLEVAVGSTPHVRIESAKDPSAKDMA